MEEKYLSENIEQKGENILNNFQAATKTKLNPSFSINIYYKNKKKSKIYKKINILFNYI